MSSKLRLIHGVAATLCNRRARRFFVGGILTLCAAGPFAHGGVMPRDEPTADTRADEEAGRRGLGERWHYGSKGLEYDPADSDTSLWIGLRFQTRFDTFPGDLRTPDDLRASKDAELDLRRGRIKGGGDLFRKWLQIYSEYDFTTDTLLDYRVTATWKGWLSFRAGQWKSEFNRERIDSSGKQQLAERSIATYWFTIDRQRALATSARFWQGTSADTRFYLEYLSGRGLGGSFDGDSGLWLGRAQWNPSGTQLPYSQSSLQRYDKVVSSVALAAIDGRTPYTRFSSSGGGSLPGFQPGDYDLRQYLFETALQYRGFGWQQELHWKRITDRLTGDVRELSGGYAQLGVFVDEWSGKLPRQLELVGRLAVVDPDRARPSDTQTEWTIGLNWFFNGHRNKLTVDYSYLDYADPMQAATKNRFRLQWELSL